MTDSIRVTLPWPPSVNRYWRSFRGRNILSKEARAYKVAARAVIERNGWKVTGPVRVAFTLYPPDKRLRDGDNVGKPMFDALVSAGAIDGDDNRVVLGHSVEWAATDKQNPRVEVVIQAVGENGGEVMSKTTAKLDIVERLRKLANEWNEADCIEAAAEIKRLRNDIGDCRESLRLEVLEIERLRAALKKIAEHHEDQAEAWGGEEGDSNNVRYHAERARIANAAYDPPA